MSILTDIYNSAVFVCRSSMGFLSLAYICCNCDRSTCNVSIQFWLEGLQMGLFLGGLWRQTWTITYMEQEG